ncbi:VOC family protein [Candidatus Lokiarchaeum ossiferum]|uniref:VOC family protein n=1 Tax=Candidatus Lokiarchaeum ossiferum TaxID=2951803 RepID=UPI00352CB3BB
MKFCWCTLHVKDLERSLKFYQEIVGLSINRRFEARPGINICFLGEGETQVELIEDEHSIIPKNQDHFSLGFEVDSLDRMLEFVQKQGINIESGPFQPNPNTKFFYVLDPDNYKIQFVEQMNQ